MNNSIIVINKDRRLVYPTKTSLQLVMFYIIQLDPIYLPNRLKLGYSSNLGQRIQEHCITNPNLKLVKAYQCRIVDEKYAIEFITRTNAYKVKGEVYDVITSLDLLLVDADYYFTMGCPMVSMPVKPTKPHKLYKSNKPRRRAIYSRGP